MNSINNTKLSSAVLKALLTVIIFGMIALYASNHYYSEIVNYIYNVLSYVFVSAAHLIGGMEIEEASNAFYDSFVLVGAPAIISILLSVIVYMPYYVYYSLQKRELNKIVKPCKAFSAHPFMLTVFAIGAMNIIGLAASVIQSNFLSSSVETSYAYPADSMGVILTFVEVAIIPPLIEEWAYRHVLLRALLPYNKYFALFFSAFVFGLLHFSFTQSISAFFFGILIGFVYINTGSVWQGVMIHMINNALSVFSTYVSQCVTDSVLSKNITGMLYTLPMIFAIIIAVYYIISPSKSPFKINDKFFAPNGEESLSSLFRALFKCKTMYLFIVLYISMAVYLHA